MGMPYTNSHINSKVDTNQVSSQKSLKSGNQDGKRLPSEPQLSIEDDEDSISQSVSISSVADEEERKKIEQSDKADVQILKSQAYQDDKESETQSQVRIQVASSMASETSQ